MACIFISFLVISEYYKILKIKNLLYVFSFILLLGVMVSISTYLFEDAIFQEKILKTFDELLIDRYTDIVTINTLWRGYESYRGLEDFMNGSFINKIFGNGFGHLIDLKIIQELGDREFRFVPYTHNGYIYILVKFGLIGMFLYFMFFYRIMTNPLSNNRTNKFHVKINE